MSFVLEGSAFLVAEVQTLREEAAVRASYSSCAENLRFLRVVDNESQVFMQNLFVLLIYRFEDGDHLFKDAGLLHVEPHIPVPPQGQVDVPVELVCFFGDEEHFVVRQEHADLLQQERAHLSHLQLLPACFLLAHHGVLTISDQIDDVAVALHHFEVELRIGENALFVPADLRLGVIGILEVFELLDGDD